MREYATCFVFMLVSDVISHTRPDSYEPYDKYASHSDLPVSAPSLGPLRRPALQKDYLAHVDVFHGHEPSASTSSPNRPSAPHVSLIYNNHEYSLFRQTSTPSGDDEEVLFGEREESQTDQQSLYYNSLEHFLEALHSVFPDMKGDGDTELTLDFGILDMQISEVSSISSLVPRFMLTLNFSSG